MIVTQNHGDAPRLSLGQIMALTGGPRMVPAVRGWVQGTKRLLPDCPRCGKMVFFDEVRQDYVCDHCHLDTGIERGRITSQFAQPNLLTRAFWQTFMLYQDYGNGYYVSAMKVFISNDDTGVHEFKDLVENTANGTKNSGDIGWSLNSVLEYATYTYTFSAPTSNRTIRQVGLMKAYNGFYGQAANGNWTTQVVQSVTELTSEIEQSTSETFEVVYKYQFSEVTP